MPSKTTEQLLTDAYKSTHWAADMLSEAYRKGFAKAKREDALNILSRVREANTAMQEAVNRLSGMKPPREGD